MGSKKTKALYYELSSLYSRIFNSKKWFMNYGYFEEKEIALQPADEKYRFHIQLYNHILHSANLKGQNVLEISCGRGGGCNYLMNYHFINSVTGIDLAKNNIALCKKLILDKNAAFYVANAETFNLTEKLFDTVINLEASHNYADKHAFFVNVNKHLLPAGYFFFADAYPEHKLKEIENIILSTGFKLEKFEDISAGVIKSIELNSKLLYPLSSRFPKLIPKKIKNMQGNSESLLYKKLKSGEMKYVSYVFSKL